MFSNQRFVIAKDCWHSEQPMCEWCKGYIEINTEFMALGGSKEDITSDKDKSERLHLHIDCFMKVIMKFLNGKLDDGILIYKDAINSKLGLHVDRLW